MKRLTILLGLFCLLTISLWGQKVAGNPNELSDIKVYNLVFDYSGIDVGKYESEEAFLEDKIAKREAKEVGLGEAFKKSWFEDRENRFEPKFIGSFNKRFNGELTIGENNSEYTVKVHTTWVYPGYNVGIVRHDAQINAVISIYRTAMPDDIILSLTYKKVRGRGAMGYDFNSGYRISECYAKLAKNFSKYISKKILK